MFWHLSLQVSYFAEILIDEGCSASSAAYERRVSVNALAPLLTATGAPSIMLLLECTCPEALCLLLFESMSRPLFLGVASNERDGRPVLLIARIGGADRGCADRGKVTRRGRQCCRGES